MKEVLLHPAYFGSILQFSVLSQSQGFVFEAEDNYQKQTYRNRQYIYGANGKLLLNIPIKHTHNKAIRQKYKDVKIENDFRWQTIHWRSLQAAYRTSPFFEFYEDELFPLYEKKFDYLLDFNLHCFETIAGCLQLSTTYQQTSQYHTSETLPKNLSDGRKYINAKKQHGYQPEPYTQVFESKYGFIGNLSVLDLLFNEGTNALQYLERQKIQQ